MDNTARLGIHQARMLAFLTRYSGKWHTFATDAQTQRTARTLAARGLIEVNAHSQARLA